jgi:DNA (cytosine-5)-methyltransferase 1
MQNLSTVDLFSGCGGMSLGFQNAGFKILAAFDNWGPAVEVYKNNFSHPIYNLDLSKEKSIEFVCSLKPNIIIGGPPCQDFSIAGKRNERSGRSNLTITFAKIVAISKPEWFVMENVYTIDKSKVLQKASEILKSVGYGLTMDILDASYCGVPQARRRFFMIGQLGSEDQFLKPHLDKNKSDRQMTIYDYLGDSLGTEYYYVHPRSYKRRAVFSIHEPSATIRGVNRPIPKAYKKHPGDVVAISSKVRALTTIERGYIQTFPSLFKFKGTKTSLEQIIGNAVPVKLAEYVAKTIREYQKKSKRFNMSQGID